MRVLRFHCAETLFDLPAILQVCHSKHCEETSPESLTTPLVCHSEPA
ncbi:hypothetical protein [Helicobacter marmotae]|nr:hypothetical protein [Helicobacter marmotae]